MSLSRGSRDFQVLLDTIFAEARGESEQGQRAVAWVIKNRADMNRPYWGGGSIADVCLRPGQFECWNGNGAQKIEEDKRREPGAVAEIEAWLPNVFLGRDPSNGSDHYNNPSKEGYPPWTANCHRTVKIGNHQFYRGL